MAEVPITQICKLFAALIAISMSFGTVDAKRTKNAEAMSRYVEARLAELSHDHVVAANIYAEKLKEQPNNIQLAGKAYVKAMEVGDFALALKAVRILESTGRIDPEMPLVLFTDAFVQRDWQRARTATAQLTSLNNFGFLTPLLNAWIDVAAGDDPKKSLKAVKENKTANFYYEEQYILNLLARKGDDQARSVIERIVVQNDVRMGPLRILVARHFVAMGSPDNALAVLRFKSTGPESRLFRAIKSGLGKKSAQRVDAKIGLAFLFQRMAGDLGTQRAPFLALVGAQMGAQIAPDNDYGHLILGRRYADSQNIELALKELENINKTSPYSLVSLNTQIFNLMSIEQFDRAEIRIEKAVKESTDIPELRILKGQVLQLQQKHKEAAAAFSTAIDLAEKQGYSNAVLANYWLSLGGAQEQAGIWPTGLESLRKANALQPQSASILNYLGYAQLERRENTKSAVAAIQQAHKLRSSSPAITDSLGWAYFLTGEHNKAVEFLERALEGEPQDATINEHLGDAYWTVGRKYEARYAWKSARLFADVSERERLSDKIDLGLRPESTAP